MRYCYIILLLVVAFSVRGQGFTTKSKKAISAFKNAQTCYASDQFDEALNYLDGALKKDERFIEAYLLKADIYFTQKNYPQEILMLEKAFAIDSLYYVPALFNMGVAKYHTGKYDEVKSWMKQYKMHRGRRSNLRADEWISKAEFAKNAVTNPIYIEPTNLGKDVNSDLDEYWPSISADGRTMIFTVLNPKDPFVSDITGLPKNSLHFKEDFYGSVLVDGQWQKREAVVSINTNGNEGAQTLSADGQWMFFTACGRKGGKGSCDIYFSKRTRGGWSDPVNIGAPVNTPFWESQPSFSADGRTLYFVSSRPGGVGKKDIWQAKIIGYKLDGTPFFGKLNNLGKQVNTNADENSPFIHSDNQTLYFSSEGWPGMGDMDLFLSKKDEHGQWQKPVNLGYPLNTESDEIGLVINARGDLGFFSSDGLDVGTDKDIYQFTMPKHLRPVPVAYVKGRVFDKKTGELLQADVKINELESGNLSADSRTTDYSGEFMVCLPTGKEYGLNIQKKGYLFYSDYFNVTDPASVDQPHELKVYLSKIQVGERFVLRNVFFDTDAFVLKPASFVELDYVVKLLKLNADLKIEIGGHTDNVGARTYNLNLSEKRAEAVFNYLLNKGIERVRLSYKGYGFDQPVDTNDTETGKAQNRRTELKVL